jgi:CHAT domain-containing protein/tetratricopeptide (TPR) repeat protein
LVRLYKKIGSYAAAEPLLREVLEIRRETLGEQHPDYATTLNDLADLHKKMGAYTAAEPLLRQALEIRRETCGQQHPDYATTLNSLANLLCEMGDYAAAEPLLRQALEIRREALGPDHPKYAACLNNLAVWYQTMGHYAAAELLLRQALEIRRETCGEQHPSLCRILNNLAELYRLMGDYTASEPLYRQALGIRRKALERALRKGRPTFSEGREFAQSLNCLAGFYRVTGDYAAAESLLRQALQIRRLIGEKHPSYAVTLSNLAGLYEALADYARAEPLYQQALEAARTSLGEKHPHVATILSNLAGLHRLRGDYAAAEPLYRQAMEVNCKTFGRFTCHHPNFASSLSNLASLYEEMGDYAAAEPLLRQALEIRREALGDQHPDYAVSLYSLAMLLVSKGDASAALPLMEQGAAIDDRMLGQVFSISSESQRMAFLGMIRVNLDLFLSLARRHFEASPEAARTAFEKVLRRKAIGAEALAIQRDALLSGDYPALEQRLRELSALRMKIARATMEGLGRRDKAVRWRRLLDRWTARREELEAELARHIPEINVGRKLRAADRRAVVFALPEDGALVEFVRFHVFDFFAVPARGEDTWRPPCYLAFVVRANEPDDVQMVDLGPAELIDRLIADFRALIANDPDGRTGRDMVKRWTEPAAGVPGNAGESLREAVFDRLVPALGGRGRLLIAPDGDLTRLPFEVLPTTDGRRLIDDHQISYLSCGRDVLRFGFAPSRRPTEPLILADPDFDLGREETAPLGPPLGTPGRHSRDIGQSSFEFDRLPGTRTEGERIADLLAARLWVAGEALEGRLRAECRSPCVLHLATHGFFLEDQELRHAERMIDSGILSESQGGSERLSGPLPENPMLRSGLALAGANTWLKAGTPPAEAEDGLLTAEDVSSLDLLATELVVLSACETGLGQVHVGEGVFGLRRAFVLAGAKTLVMSLWKVPDEPTRELMEDFYGRLLAGEGRAEALRLAQLAMKARYPDPFYWGAFICQGDPSSLGTVRPEIAGTGGAPDWPTRGDVSPYGG